MCGSSGLQHGHDSLSFVTLTPFLANTRARVPPPKLQLPELPAEKRPWFVGVQNESARDVALGRRECVESWQFDQ